mgnify:CR=1 FL=1|jgi:hypothetical protein
MQQDRERRKVEENTHSILLQIKDLKNNDLAHMEKRLTKLEVASNFHTALLMITIAAILGFGIAGLAL